MTSQHIKVDVAHIGMIDGVKIGNLGEERTRKLSKRMHSQVVKDESGELSRSQLKLGHISQKGAIH